MTAHSVADRNPRPPWIVWVGLAVVLLAAAVLSFEALQNLALTTGISARWAWLLPIAVDAGAAVSCSVWLGGRSTEDAAVFAGRMTWALLWTTVAGNAAQLGMASAHIVPPWWVAVFVGAIPPAVVGATVHLLVLLVRRADRATDQVPVEQAETVTPPPPPAPEPEVAAIQHAEPTLSPTTPTPVVRLVKTPRATSKQLTDTEAEAQYHRWVRDYGRPPRTKRERRDATGCGGDRAERLAAEFAGQAAEGRLA